MYILLGSHAFIPPTEPSSARGAVATRVSALIAGAPLGGHLDQASFRNVTALHPKLQMLVSPARLQP